MSQANFRDSTLQSAGWLIWLLPMTLVISFVAIHLSIPRASQAWPDKSGITDDKNHTEALGALSHELDELVRMELVQRVQVQLSDPHVVAKSLSDVVADELNVLIREAGGDAMQEVSAGVPEALQRAAREHVETQLRAAIGAGFWDAGDTQAVLPHMGVISPEDRVELSRLFHEALAQGRIDLEGPMPPL